LLAGGRTVNATDFEAKLPAVSGWIERLIENNRRLARPVSSFGFTRLPVYFSDDTLARANVVVVDSVPKPPFAALGLEQFADFESMELDGITYRDFYFLNRALVDDESLHFHELIHIVQWHVLGAERFLLAYALGHVSVGVYRNNPFERIAYDLQARFVDLPNPFQVEPLVLRHLRETVPS
jgi:hypothetical protein